MHNQRQSPNCNSPRFVDTPAVEWCPDCGLRCDYHGDGANEVYSAYLERKWADQERAQEEESRAYMDRTYGEGNW